MRLRASSWLWIGLNAVLLAVAVNLPLATRRPGEVITSIRPRASAIPAVPVDTATALNYAQLRDRAIFHTSRAYVVPPALDPSGPAPPDYQFVAALVLPTDRSVAYLRHPGAPETRKVRVGEDLDGWRVANIEATRVILESQGRSHEIALAARATIAGITRVSLAAPAPTPAAAVRILGNRGAMLIAREPSARLESPPRLYQPPK